MILAETRGLYALHYLSAQLRLSIQRNFTKISQLADVSMQNRQHFMTNSPWDASLPLWQVQREIARTSTLQQGGVLILEESATEKASARTVGAGPQYNGRLGKVEMSQVGTFLAFAHLQSNLWTCIDGELFVPEACFAKDKEAQRERLGFPHKRAFATKVELGWKMIQRVKGHNLPFEAVACDALYGRADWFRQAMHKAGIRSMAAVDSTPQVAASPFECQADLIWTVAEGAERPSTLWQRLTVRPTERGSLTEDFACLRVYPCRDGLASPQWLVLRRSREGEIAYSFCNAPQDVSLEYLARLACVRYFVERANQDAMSEIGWDELRAQKWRAWEHHLALTVMGETRHCCSQPQSSTAPFQVSCRFLEFNDQSLAHIEIEPTIGMHMQIEQRRQRS